MLNKSFLGGSLKKMGLIEHISCAVETGVLNVFGKPPSYPDCTTVAGKINSEYRDTLFVNVSNYALRS